MFDLAVKWAAGYVQETWNRAVNDPKSTFAGFGWGGTVVAVITYLEQQLHCDLTQIKFLAIANIYQGMRGKDSQRTVGDDAHDQASQA